MSGLLDRIWVERDAPPTGLYALTARASGPSLFSMKSLPQMTAAEMAALRALMNKTQAEMAVLFGVDLRTFRRWENNERSIPGPAVILARVYSKKTRNNEGFGDLF